MLIFKFNIGFQHHF